MKEKLIFFVDDDKLIINLLEYTFKGREGLEVLSFFSGEDCLKNLDKGPSLIVLDHLLTLREGNALDGLDTLKLIREKDKNVSVIMLSGQQDKTLIDEFMRHGAKKYIAKEDYFIDTLIASIEEEIKT